MLNTVSNMMKCTLLIVQHCCCFVHYFNSKHLLLYYEPSEQPSTDYVVLNRQTFHLQSIRIKITDVCTKLDQESSLLVYTRRNGKSLKIS